MIETIQEVVAKELRDIGSKLVDENRIVRYEITVHDAPIVGWAIFLRVAPHKGQKDVDVLVKAAGRRCQMLHNTDFSFDVLYGPKGHKWYSVCVHPSFETLKSLNENRVLN